LTLLYTLTVGTLAWWFSTHAMASRFAIGLGAPWVYGAVFVFVLALAVRGVKARRAAAESPAVDAPPHPLLRAVRAALLIAAPITLVLALAFGAINVGDGGLVIPMVIGWFGLLAVPIALAVGGIAGWFRGVTTPPTQPLPPAISGRDVLAALAPLLVPLAAMILLRNISAGAWWEVRTDGPPRAGILHVTLVPLMLPVAVIVSWGLDRLDGSRGSVAAGTCAAVALAALVAALWFLPQLLVTWHDNPNQPYQAPAQPGALQIGNPFHTAIPDDPPGSGTAPLLPLTDFFRASALMMLLAAALTAFALRRLGLGVRALSLPRVSLTLLLQVLLTMLAMPRLGLVGAPLAAAAALAVAALPTLLMPTGATPVARR